MMMLARGLLRCMPRFLAEPLYYRLAGHFIGNGDEQTVKLRYGKNALLAVTGTDSMHRAIATLGCYERDLSEFITSQALHGGLFIDVGANIGYFSVLWLSMNGENRAACFEPVESNAAFIEKNLRLNSLTSRAQVITAACGVANGQADFANFWGTSETGCGGFVNAAEARNASLVKVVRLDEAITSEMGEIAFLKIDAEGADTLVLKGAERLLQEQRVKTISFEQNYWRMEALGIGKGEAARFLAGFGYAVRRFGPANLGLEQYLATRERFSI